MPKLTDNTVVVNPQTGEPALLAAGGDVPDWAVDLVGDHLLDGPVQRSTKTQTSSEDPEKAAMRARIADLEAAQRPPSGDGPAKPDYDDLTLPNLRSELERRDLPTSGNKPELVARLREHDDQQSRQ